MFWFCLVLALTASCLAGPVENERTTQRVVSTEDTPATVTQQVMVDPRNGRSYRDNDVRQFGRIEESLVEKINMKCAKRDPSSCAMLKLVTYMNRLLKKANIDIVDNVEITQTSPVVERAEDLPRSIAQESDESQMATLISAKLLSFVRSRALRLRLLPDTEAVITSNPDSHGNLNLGMSLEKVAGEGRGKQKHMSGMLAAMVMKFGMLAAMAFKGLVLLVGKALLISKIALLLAVVLGLKKLFSHHQKHVTYEVVAQPHHSHAHIEHIDHGHSGGGGGGGHDSYSSGWGRSSDQMRNDAHRMAYRGYVPKQ